MRFGTFHLIGAPVSLAGWGDAELLGHVADDQPDRVALVTLQPICDRFEDAPLLVTDPKLKRACP